MSKHIKIITVILSFTTALAAVGFIFVAKRPTENHSRKNEKNVSQIKNIKQPVSDSSGSYTNQKQYILILEDGNICAYEVADGRKNLIEYARVETTLMTNDEISRLTSGISASSFEDLCMFFESYTS